MKRQRFLYDFILDQESLVRRVGWRLSEPDDYIAHVHARLVIAEESHDESDEESEDEIVAGEVIGSLDADLLLAEPAARDHFDPFFVADADAEMRDAASEVYVESNGTSFQDGLAEEGAFAGNMLLLRKLEVVPAHRGIGLGLALMQELLTLVQHDIAVLKATPLQYLDYTDGLSPELVPFADVGLVEGTRKLEAYYARIGFVKVGGQEHMMRFPQTDHSRLELPFKR